MALFCFKERNLYKTINLAAAGLFRLAAVLFLRDAESFGLAHKKILGERIMKPGIHNYSEIGKLNKVLLHRIGEEVEGLVPDNFERLLFDDIPFLKVAQQEHDRFAE